MAQKTILLIIGSIVAIAGLIISGFVFYKFKIRKMFNTASYPPPPPINIPLSTFNDQSPPQLSNVTLQNPPNPPHIYNRTSDGGSIWGV